MNAQEKTQEKIDPLHRAFVPIEKRNVNGQLMFKTLDKTLYVRTDAGAIRRAVPKVRGKKARRAEKEARRHARNT